jgi:hypothetical protein
VPAGGVQVVADAVLVNFTTHSLLVELIRTPVNEPKVPHTGVADAVALATDWKLEFFAITLNSWAIHCCGKRTSLVVAVETPSE